IDVANAFLFNFAASRSEGGYKRLYEYSRWFNSRGGAWFAIHPLCEPLRQQFPRNRYFIVDRSNLKRLCDDWSYLRPLLQTIGQPELYYAYGIPLYARIGQVNWAHLNNVLTLSTRDVPLSLFHRMKVAYLGGRIRRGFALADVISAESQY